MSGLRWNLLLPAAIAKVIHSARTIGNVFGDLIDISEMLRVQAARMSLHGRRFSPYAGFAVVDTETTGLYPSVDRIVEVAIVHLDSDGQVTGEFCTLLDPGRDVGPTTIHGIRASDVVGAPPFTEAAAAVWSLLAGRVLVAHNVGFDARFLDAELRRCGACLPPVPVMCTMTLAASYLPGLPSRSLAACCDAAEIQLAQHHSALDDARAAAALLARYRRSHPDLPASWAQALTQAANTSWAPGPSPCADFRSVTRTQQHGRRAAQPAPLAALIDHLPRGRGGDLDSYLGVLDRVLEDRRITDQETDTLSGLAAELGLARDTAEQAHHQYLHHLADAAWRDHVVTDLERADLLEVARLLDVPAAEALGILDNPHISPAAESELPAASVLRPGDRVVFTGDMSTSRSQIEALATAAGLIVTSAVSGKTALVIAADPHSQSGKARQARDRGIRMVTEQVFLHLLDNTSAIAAPVSGAPPRLEQLNRA